MSRRYSLDPLAEATGLSVSALGRELRLSGTTWKEARDDGISELRADRYATRMGLPALAVWADFGWIECASPDCQVTFPPTAHDRRYCDRLCRQRTWAREQYRSNPKFKAMKIESARNYYAECGPYVRARVSAYGMKQRAS